MNGIKSQIVLWGLLSRKYPPPGNSSFARKASFSYPLANASILIWFMRSSPGFKERDPAGLLSKEPPTVFWSASFFFPLMHNAIEDSYPLKRETAASYLKRGTPPRLHFQTTKPGEKLCIISFFPPFLFKKSPFSYLYSTTPLLGLLGGLLYIIKSAPESASTTGLCLHSFQGRPAWT